MKTFEQYVQQQNEGVTWQEPTSIRLLNQAIRYARTKENNEWLASAIENIIKKQAQTQQSLQPPDTGPSDQELQQAGYQN